MAGSTYEEYSYGNRWRSVSAEATDTKTIADLMDPECEIPYDIHFDIEDDAGATLGTLGGHKAIMALKSPVFKAMLFGPMKETGDSIKIKGTSLFAFKRILNYIHDVEEEECWPWSIDVSELVRIIDLSERFNLDGLKEKTIKHADRVFLFPKERLLEIARVAEEHHRYKELSESLLENCTNLLSAIIETPEHFNELVKEWSKKSPEEASIALRLLARLEQQYLPYNIETCQLEKEVISHSFNIARHIQPRSRLQKIKRAFEDTDDASRHHVMMGMVKFSEGRDVLLDSLWICQKKDAEFAVFQGIPLKLDTPVEDHFTHGESVKLHLDLISLKTIEAEKWWGNMQLGKESVDRVWKELVRAIPEVKPIILSWFINNFDIFSKDAIRTLAHELFTCDEDVKKLPDYENASDLFRYMGYGSY